MFLNIVYERIARRTGNKFNHIFFKKCNDETKDAANKHVQQHSFNVKICVSSSVYF